MSTTKRIVCLANSRKMSGRCVAGREIVDGKPGPWVRPVSDRLHQEVSERERRYQDGTEPRLLDIMEITFLRHEPHGYQSENWLLDPGRYWQRERMLDPRAVEFLVGPEAALWTNGYSSRGGMNDRVPDAMAATHASSLRLVKVSGSILHSETNPYSGRFEKKLRARFNYLGTPYTLRVTDPEIEDRYGSEPDGDYPLDPCFLTISLGEPFEGFVYKLVAGVIPVAAVARQP